VKPIIAVVGGSTCSPDETVAAAMVGRLLSEAGAVILCGGLGGVMEAVAKGAQAGVGGVTVGILPGSDPAAANSYIDVPLATGMGEMRNALIVRGAQAVIAIGGGVGTLSGQEPRRGGALGVGAGATAFMTASSNGGVY